MEGPDLNGDTNQWRKDFDDPTGQPEFVIPRQGMDVATNSGWNINTVDMMDSMIYNLHKQVHVHSQQVVGGVFALSSQVTKSPCGGLLQNQGLPETQRNEVCSASTLLQPFEK